MAFSISEDNKKVILLLNLSEKESTFYLKCENLSDKTFLNLLSETIIQYSCHQQFSLMPYDYLILGRYFVRMFFKIDSQLGLSNLSISFRKQALSIELN